MFSDVNIGTLSIRFGFFIAIELFQDQDQKAS